MVREEYDFNRVFNPTGLAPASLGLLFNFTGQSGQDVPVPSNWIIDWERFFEFPRPARSGKPLNLARKLDPFAAPTLHNLPLGEGRPELNSLPFRNLMRGSRIGLPTGQAAAAKLGLRALAPSDIATGSDGAVAQAHGFDVTTPLWYYILKEAEVAANGDRLGPVGSRILAEVFVGLLEGDGNSFLAQAPEWRPTLGDTPGEFTMADLLTVMGEVNPIGDAST